jgi:hypothetical protein
VEYAKKSGDEMGVIGVKMVLKFALSVDWRQTFGVNNTTIVLNRSS